MGMYGTITNIEVPDTVNPGESFTLPVTIMSKYSNYLSFKVEVEFNGRTKEKTATLPPHWTHTFEFELFAPETPKTHTGTVRLYYYTQGSHPWVLDETKQFNIVVQEGGTGPKADIQYVKVNGEPVGKGEMKTVSKADITIDVGVKNTGESGDITVDMSIKNSDLTWSIWDAKTVSINAGMTKKVTFSKTLPKADIYKITIKAGH